jgi:hypothetical protein
MNDENDQPKRRVVWDPSISLNTLVVCATLAETGLTLIDRVSDGKAEVARMRIQIEQLQAADANIAAQRQYDRSELREALNEIKAALAELNRKQDFRRGDRQ